MLCRRVPRGCVRLDCVPLISDLPLGKLVDLAWRTLVHRGSLFKTRNIKQKEVN